MATMLKHVGKVGEKPCVVVFRELPGDSDHALVIYSAQLESRQHDELMSAVMGPEAQTSNDISQVLHRKLFSDGSNMLTSLHYGKKLHKVPTNMVALTPVPNQSVPLDAVNAELRKIAGGHVPPKTDPSHASSPAQQPVMNTIAPVADVTAAQGLLAQADLMERDAQAILRDAASKREQAYRMDPNLKQMTLTEALTQVTPKPAKRTSGSRKKAGAGSA